jgi:NTE family protein
MTDARALVLGGGGVTGVGWELGIIAGLAELGIDLAGAARVIGTSAGSVVGAQLTSGAPIETVYATQLEPPSTERVASVGLRQKLGYGTALFRSRGDVTAFGHHLGRWSMAAAKAGRLPSLEQRRDAIRSRLPSLDWPDRDLRIVAVDAHTGERRVFTSEDGVDLLDAVAASCAVPGVYPPVPVAGRTYIDGGVHSIANADLAAGCAAVVALTPLDQAVGPLRRARSQLDRLGVPAIVVMPDAGALTAIGKNVLDPAARAAAAESGRRQAASVSEAIRAVWS